MHVIVILLCHLLVNQKVFMTQEINSMDEKEDSFKGEIDETGWHNRRLTYHMT